MASISLVVLVVIVVVLVAQVICVTPDMCDTSSDTSSNLFFF